MGYPKFTDQMVKVADEMQHTKGLGFAKLLQNLSHIFTTPTVTAGAAGATAALNAFVAPTKLRITKATAVLQVVQTGTGNTPTVELYNLTKTEVVGVTAAIALAGAIGQKNVLVLDATKTVIDEGDVLQWRVVNPAGTITVAMQSMGVVEWNAEA